MDAWKLTGSLVPIGVLAGAAFVANPSADGPRPVLPTAVDGRPASSDVANAPERAAVIHAAGSPEQVVIQPVEGKLWSWGWGFGRKKDEAQRAPSRSANGARQPSPYQTQNGPLAPEPDPRFDRRTPMSRAVQPTPVDRSRPPLTRGVPRPVEIAPDLEPTPAPAALAERELSVPRRGARPQPALTPTPTVAPPATQRFAPAPLPRVPATALPGPDPFASGAPRASGPALDGPALFGPTPLDEPVALDEFDDSAEATLPLPPAPQVPVLDESREISLPVQRAVRRPVEAAPPAPSPDFTPEYSAPSEPFEGIEPTPEPRTRTAAQRPPTRDARRAPAEEDRGSRFGDGWRRLFPLLRR